MTEVEAAEAAPLVRTQIMRDCLHGRLIKLTLDNHTEATITNGKDQGVGAEPIVELCPP